MSTAAGYDPGTARQHIDPRERALDDSSKGWSIRHRLMLLALAVALPFMLLTAGIVWQLANNERETRREAILFSTRTLMNAVDTILEQADRGGADAGDLAGPARATTCRRSARRPSARRTGLSDGWIVLSEQNGQQLVNLQPGPRRRAADRRSAAWRSAAPRHRDSARCRFPTCSAARVLQAPVVTVEVPVLRARTSLRWCISIVMQPERLPRAVRAVELAGGLARGPDRPQWQFHRALAQSRSERRPARIRGLSHRGSRSAGSGLERDACRSKAAPSPTAHVTSPLSGWVMGLAADKTLFEAPIRNTILRRTRSPAARRRCSACCWRSGRRGGSPGRSSRSSKAPTR